MQKITDPKRQVTDPTLLSYLARMSVNPAFVMFEQDYGSREYGRSPYSKRYRNLKNGKSYFVCKSLPMCRADGVRLTPGWERGVDKYHSKTNLFIGTVWDNGKILLTPTNDQPNGMQTNDNLVWNPQIFLDGIEVPPLAIPALLPVDPYNKNYQDNVIKFDHGFCERRVRTIEGQVQERWIFNSNPGADVRIVHNHTGKGLRLGQYAIDDDVEFIPLAAFQQALYPFEISAGGTFYPDDDPESTSVDGGTQRHNQNQSWATLEAGAGTGAWDSLTNHDLARIQSNTSPNWKDIGRAITVFDASVASGTVSAVSLSFYGDAKLDQCGIAPATNVYSANPASNTAIIAADHTTLGTTKFCDTNITYAAWSVAAGYNNVFDFNAAGIAAVQAAIDGDGIVKLGQREALYDAGAGTPAHPGSGNQWTYMRAFSADEGSGFEPKLIIEATADLSTSASVTIEGKVEGTLTVGWRHALSALIEGKVDLAKKVTFPASALIEGKVDLAKKVTFPASVIIEGKAAGEKKLNFPASVLIEGGVEFVRPGFDYMANYQEATVRCTIGTGTPAEGTVMAFTYKYRKPVLILDQDPDSQAAIAAIEGGDGVIEHIIKDDSLSSSEEAYDRAQADLEKYANPIVYGSFETLEHGFEVGQTLVVNRTGESLNGNYQIQSVVISCAGGVEHYVVTFAASLYDLVDFLLNLKRKADRIELREDEVVPLLKTIEAAVALGTEVSTDLVGHPAKWGAATPQVKWGLFTWG